MRYVQNSILTILIQETAHMRYFLILTVLCTHLVCPVNTNKESSNNIFSIDGGLERSLVYKMSCTNIPDLELIFIELIPSFPYCAEHRCGK